MAGGVIKKGYDMRLAGVEGLVNSVRDLTLSV